ASLPFSCALRLARSAVFPAFFRSIIRLPPSSPLFPYTTLFRSQVADYGSHNGCRIRHFGRGTRRFETRADCKERPAFLDEIGEKDRKSTRLNSSHVSTSYAVFCLKKKTSTGQQMRARGGPAHAG